MAPNDTTTRPILGYDRRTGEPIALVPSTSRPGLFHIATMDGGCSCEGYRWRGRCKHAGQPVRRAPAKVADGASLYDQIWGENKPERPSGPPLVARLMA